MKQSIAFFLAIMIPVIGNCQSQFSLRFSVGGASLSVSPAGEGWVTTKGGGLWYTDKIGDLWTYIPTNGEEDSLMIGKGTYEKITVFSKDTLMISGYIHGDLGNADIVLRSEDKGKTWKEVKFGNESWINCTCQTDDGRAWMSGSSEFIYYTKDSGRNWEQIDKSHLIGDTRLVSAATSPKGDSLLFGATWGDLYITKDNCITLTPVPTPHSQGKYPQKYLYEGFSHKRPKISKIRFYGDKYLLIQDERVFINRSDSIDWQPLKRVRDFEVTEAGNLYTILEDGSVGLYDKDYDRIWSSTEKMSKLPQSIACRNESLYAICDDEAYKINPEEFIVSGLFTDDFEIGSGIDGLIYDECKITYEGITYAYDNKDLMCRDVGSGKWYRFMTVPFYIGNAVVYGNDLLLSDDNYDRYYKLDIENKKVIEYSFADDFILTPNNRVKSMTLETASVGCFHQEVAILKYTRKNRCFVADKSSGRRCKIDESVINRLVSAIIESRNNTLSLSDLQLTESDIQDYKNRIMTEVEKQAKGKLVLVDESKPYTFPDFETDIDYYINMADSLYMGAVSDSVIDAALKSEYGNRCTTLNWKSVDIVFQGKQTLKIINMDDRPNYMLTPWLVEYEGVKFKGNSLTIGRILTALVDEDFISSPFKDKTYLIFNIVNYMYERKIAP